MFEGISLQDNIICIAAYCVWLLAKGLYFVNFVTLQVPRMYQNKSQTMNINGGNLPFGPP